MKICFVYSNRAEYSILSPFISYFKKRNPSKNIKVINLHKNIKAINHDKNLSKIYSFCFQEFVKNKYNYVCILGDRKELSFIALAAFHTDTNLVHIAAGEFTQGIPTHDQYIRPIISILSKYQICFSNQAKQEVKKLFDGISYLKPKVYVFGNPVFAEINVNSIKRSIDDNYDLVLLHPQSLSREHTKQDLIVLRKKLQNKKTIFIEGNKDKNYDLIENFYKKLKGNSNYIFLKSLPKEKYFSFVKYCDNFYTNSSSISEIKFLNKKCLYKIGLRNKHRFESKLDDHSPIKLYNLLRKSLT